MILGNMIRFSILTLVLTFSLPSLSGEHGGNSSGGGNVYADEFRQIARDLLKRIKFKFPIDIIGIKISDLSNAVESYKVEATEDVLKKDGVQVDALNFPSEKRILLSLLHWKKDLTPYQKSRLALHEFLGAMGLEDTRFEKTHKIFEETALNVFIKMENFSVGGPVADLLIQRVSWKKDADSLERQKCGYFNVGFLICTPKNASLGVCESPKKGESICEFEVGFGGTASVTDDRQITVTFFVDGNYSSPSIAGDKWKSFNKNSASPGEFDWGLVKGRYPMNGEPQIFIQLSN